MSKVPFFCRNSLGTPALLPNFCLLPWQMGNRSAKSATFCLLRMMTRWSMLGSSLLQYYINQLLVFAFTMVSFDIKVLRTWIGGIPFNLEAWFSFVQHPSCPALHNGWLFVPICYAITYSSLIFLCVSLLLHPCWSSSFLPCKYNMEIIIPLFLRWWV